MRSNKMHIKIIHKLDTADWKTDALKNLPLSQCTVQWKERPQLFLCTTCNSCFILTLTTTTATTATITERSFMWQEMLNSS
jgi:hypothetical protein